ncbi:hypothetical protein WJX73_000975 [Symbiochloris irregularis]|uniref:Ubiquitin-like protein ATG12 n=1 Tax=Symbiochloris irregularis TaxID=706552 RepID=A0AAW1NZD8_9CHLO
MEAVVVHLQAIGDAPLLKHQAFKVGAAEPFAKVAETLRKRTKKDRLFLYLNQAFCPSLEESVGALYQAYGSEGRLYVQYATTPAWA